MKMQQKSIPTICPISTCFAEDSLVRAFQLLDEGKDLTMCEERFSLTSLESLKPKDLNIFYLKMYPDSCRMTKAGRLRPSSIRYQRLGMMSSGKCLTLKISESPKVETGCTLLDFLEKDAPLKYHLSLQQLMRLLFSLSPDEKATESTGSMEWLALLQATLEALEEKQDSTMWLPIKSKTKAGYQKAHHGDGIDTAYINLNTRRGRVGVQIAHTITPSGTQGVMITFCDMNEGGKMTEDARCITARQDSGISNRKGEHSGVLVVQEAAMPVLTPSRETVRQNGRRAKNPDEPMFTLTATDEHGVIICEYDGTTLYTFIRRLMPIECFRLQGFKDDQFNKAVATGLKDSHLYKMSGNAVTVPVISALGQFIKENHERSEKYAQTK